MTNRVKANLLVGYSLCSTVAVVMLLLAFYQGRHGRAVTDAVPIEKPSGQSAMLPPELLKRDSPENIAIFSAFLLGYIKKTHGPIFAQLSGRISSAEMAELQQILVRREVDSAEAHREAALLKTNAKIKIDKIKAEASRALSLLLGEKLAHEIEDYEGAVTQRTLVNDVNQTLLYKSAILTAQQVDMMTTLIKEQSTPTLSLNASLQDVDAYIKERRAAHERIIAQAAHNLSSVQLEEFRSALELELFYLDYYKVRKQEAMVFNREINNARYEKAMR